MQMNKDELIEAYRRMCTIREFEDSIHTNNALGKVPGFIHLYAGQEASAVGVCWNLDSNDYITSTHRGHGHSIAKGCDVKAMMHEIYAKKTGICAGKGGSMHIAELEKGMLGANGIVGGGVPLACGAALTAKLKNNNGVGLAFFGDGAFNEGATLETMNLAKVLNVPMIFVLENNGFGEATPAEYAIGGEISKRAEGFGIPYSHADGHDFFSVEAAASKAIEEARNGGGPRFLEIDTYRYYGHFEGDAAGYRAKGEAEKVREEKDCLVRFRNKVCGEDIMSPQEFDEIDAQVKDFISDCVADAEAAPEPTAEDLLTDVYVRY